MVRTSGRLILSLLAGLFMAVSIAAPAKAEITEGDRSALNDMIRDYILANPEIVREALINLADREERERVEQAMVTLRKDSGDPILGNPEGGFTIYEFTDYNCGYCKRVFQPLQELIAGDDDIRLVVKEFPILSQTSVLAAQAITMDSIIDAAQSAGADIDRLQADMNSPVTAAIIDRTRAAAQALQISGTPGLVIGSQVIPGAIDLEQMREIIAAERAANS